ncbi:MAG: hypothetical protein BroJett003_16240 [Planctomycetota bacterium]|nr:MAG: hypothetical protein BroJett003_16240 [Planctomycetota bacterium]
MFAAAAPYPARNGRSAPVAWPGEYTRPCHPAERRVGRNNIERGDGRNIERTFERNIERGAELSVERDEGALSNRDTPNSPA